MKPLDSDKKGSKEVSAPAEAAQAAPVVEEKIDFSNVQVEPLFQDQVDFDTLSKSDFRAVKVKAVSYTHLAALSPAVCGSHYESRIPAEL